MDDTIDDGGRSEAEEVDAARASAVVESADGPEQSSAESAIDDPNARRTLPFSIPVVLVSFVVLWFTRIPDSLLGVISSPSLDTPARVLVSAFLAFGIGVLVDVLF